MLWLLNMCQSDKKNYLIIETPTKGDQPQASPTH